MCLCLLYFLLNTKVYYSVCLLLWFSFFFLLEMIILPDELVALQGNSTHTYLISLYFSPVYHWA